MTAHTTARANGYNFIIAFFVGLGSFTYGFDSAIVGSVIGLPSFYSYFNFEYTSSYGSSIIGANNGVYAGGGAIGCWIVNWFSDRLGRRLAIQIIAAICILSAALQTGSVHIAMFLVGRFLNGVGVGMINCTVSPFVRYRLAPPIEPMVSVVASESVDPVIDIYDVADGMSAKGWDLNALQDLLRVYVAVTTPIAKAVDILIEDLVSVVEAEKEKAVQRAKDGGVAEKQRQ